MYEYLENNKRQIILFLKKYLTDKEKEFKSINRWGKSSIKVLKDFTTRGKMIRGNLLILGYEMINGNISHEIIKAAGAAEIFHSALLIHDDIIDSDPLRRGKPTVYATYQQIAKKHNLNNSLHFGTSQAICVGDIAFFLTFNILSSLKIESEIKDTLMKLITKEMISVGLGQMEDIYLSKTSSTVRIKDIMEMFKYKTARYTFSLPLSAGAVIAKASDNEISKLDKLGELAGLIFQIKDDEIGLFGSSEITGKPIGNDIKECKRTLYYYYLKNLNKTKDLKKV